MNGGANAPIGEKPCEISAPEAHATADLPAGFSQRHPWLFVGLAIVSGVLPALILRQESTVEPAVRPRDSAPIPAASTLRPADDTETALGFFLERVRRDPEDTRSLNAFADLYLGRVRDTGNEDHLPLALTAARASLASVGARQNPGGLSALARAEFSNHEFAAARTHAQELVGWLPQKSEPYALLGDACLELGDYESAAAAFRKMEQFGQGDAGVETRLARLASLQGRTEEARQHLAAALSHLRELPRPPPQTIAWCLWQMGEAAFAVGDYETAGRHYDDVLATAPGDFRTLESLARLQAARGDLAAAIRSCEQAVRIAPAVESLALLGDLYHLAGRPEAGAARFELVARLAEHSTKIHGTPHNRALASFYANHDLEVEAAYALALEEFGAGRRDVYGADALAWTALKANRLEEAQAAMKEALRLGTLDARLFYHAGMIARATGDHRASRDWLQRALALNPGFDPRQSRQARVALEEASR